MICRTCPYCGAHLDPGEKCDCLTGAAALLTDDAVDRWEDKKTAPSAANTEDGKQTPESCNQYEVCP